MTIIGSTIFALPVLSGLLLLWVTRRDRRRQFVQNRLTTLVANTAGPATPELSLQKLRRAASILSLPKSLQALLDPAFEATGNRIRSLHLLLTGSIAAVVAIGFANRILALNLGVGMLLGFVVAVAAALAVLRIAQLRYQKHFLDVFPDALDLIRRAVKAGLPVNEALKVAGQEIPDPVGNELRLSLNQVQLGVRLIDALQQAARRVRVADFQFLVTALALQQTTGGSLAETLGNLSKVLRDRKAVRLKARALSAEAKSSAVVLAALPFVVGGMMYVTNRDLGRMLFMDPRGRFMVGIAFLSLVSGLITMYVIIKRAVR